MKDRVRTALYVLGVLVVSLGFVIGCNQQDEETASTEPLKVAFLPIVDALPFHVAKAEGFFAARDLEVELIPVSSPVDRDQLFQAGEIDGMLNELASTAVFNAAETQLQAVTIVRRSGPGSPVFRVIASPGSGIERPADLADVPIGVSMNSIIEYITVRMLTLEGLSAEQIELRSVPVIPERFALLMSGDLPAATLPDPLGAAALQAGATLVVDDANYGRYSVSVLSFSALVIERSPQSVRAFIEAWNRAVTAINEDPDGYRELFLENVPVPPSVQDSYTIPRFAEKALPTREEWDDVLNWLTEKGLIDSRPPYAESVVDEFYRADG